MDLNSKHSATDWCQFAKVNHRFTKNGVYLTVEANKLFDNSYHHWHERVRSVSAMEVQAHGMALFQKLDAQFYSQYQPLAFGDQTLVTPSDDGALLINFALYPLVF